MNSPARSRLQVAFKDIDVGQKFQFVHTAMEAAIPGTPTFQKVDTTIDGDNAIRLSDGDYVTVRPTAKIELIESEIDLQKI